MFPLTLGSMRPPAEVTDKFLWPTICAICGIVYCPKAPKPEEVMGRGKEPG